MPFKAQQQLFRGRGNGRDVHVHICAPIRYILLIHCYVHTCKCSVRFAIMWVCRCSMYVVTKLLDARGGAHLIRAWVVYEARFARTYMRSGEPCPFLHRYYDFWLAYSDFNTLLVVVLV